MLPGAQAVTFTVNSTADAVDATPTAADGVCATASGACTLRAAIQQANATPNVPVGVADVITVPTGTYQLTILGNAEDAAATGDLDITDTVTINGAGSANTIIQAGSDNTNGIDKVFSVNQNATTFASATFNGVTVRFGKNTTSTTDPTFGYIGGGIDIFGASGTPIACGSETLTVTDSVITENSVDNTAGFGGGLSSDNAHVVITNSTISNNETTAGFGGGISHTGGNCTLTMTNSTVSGNEAQGGNGGGIYFRQNSGGTSNVSLSRFFNNTAPMGSGLFRDTALGAAGTVTAVNNWWGCDGFPGTGAGPGANGCDTVDGTVDADPRVDLKVAATPTTINSGGTSMVMADVMTNTAGTVLTPGPVVLNGLTIIFGATNGTMSPPSAPLASLMATSTYTDTNCAGPATVSAKLDNGVPPTVPINCLTTTTTTTLPPTTTTTTLPPTTTTTTTLPPPTTTTLPPPTTTTLPPTTITTTLPPPAFTCNGLPATIVGTNGSEIITGTAGDDVINGRGGNDLIRGLGGRDVICGGSGNDALFGQTGNDAMNGGPGFDACSGGPGTDTAVSCEIVVGVP